MSNLPQDNGQPSQRGPSGALIFGAVALIAIVIAVGVLVAGRIGGSTPSATATPEDSNVAALVDAAQQSTGVTDVDPKAITAYELINDDGQPVSLADFAGQYTVLYFGYTYCPDFCPTTLTDYRLVMRELGDAAEKVAFVFISVDPKRDTPELLNTYVARFDPNIVGITGDVETLRKVADEFGAFFQSADNGESPYYMVDHTATKFLMNPDGQWVAQYAYGTPVDVMAEDLKQRLAAQ